MLPSLPRGIDAALNQEARLRTEPPKLTLGEWRASLSLTAAARCCWSLSHTTQPSAIDCRLFMAEASRSGPLESLEKELSCSVSLLLVRGTTRGRGTERQGQSSASVRSALHPHFPSTPHLSLDSQLMRARRPPDLHRRPLSAAHFARLPTHLLRRLFERVVLMAGSERQLPSPVYVPIMPCFGARDAAKCHRHDAFGHVSPVEPKPGQDGTGEG